MSLIIKELKEFTDPKDEDLSAFDRMILLDNGEVVEYIRAIGGTEPVSVEEAMVWVHYKAKRISENVIIVYKRTEYNRIIFVIDLGSNYEEEIFMEEL